MHQADTRAQASTRLVSLECRPNQAVTVACSWSGHINPNISEYLSAAKILGQIVNHRIAGVFDLKQFEKFSGSRFELPESGLEIQCICLWPNELIPES